MANFSKTAFMISEASFSCCDANRIHSLDTTIDVKILFCDLATKSRAANFKAFELCMKAKTRRSRMLSLSIELIRLFSQWAYNCL